MFAIASCPERSANDRLQLVFLVCGPRQSAHLAETLNGPIPDVLLMDWSAGISWGGPALLELKRSTRFENVPVVVAIDSDDMEGAIEAYLLGASCVIHKPPDWNCVISRCKRVLDFAA